ncbi:MAG: hypothetical protein HeimC2_11530 [Candidatus Heimdallarchaeota archaeon LC_2]|nr:MAG: hypothetical protein HeimC2_11530 [Candidatus Heimdallarchaeota archaeon LC_2]
MAGAFLVVFILFGLSEGSDYINSKKYQSIEEVQLTMSFESKTNFIFRIPMIHISDMGSDPPQRISPSFNDLSIVKEESDYVDISILTLNLTVNETSVEYLQINGTGTVLSLHSRMKIDNKSSKPIFSNLIQNPIYLNTNNNINMTLSLYYFSNDTDVDRGTQCFMASNIFKNDIIVNDWKMYEMVEQDYVITCAIIN